MPRFPLFLIAVVAIAGAVLVSRELGPWASRSSEPLASEGDAAAGTAGGTGSALASEAQEGSSENARRVVPRSSPDPPEEVVLTIPDDALWVEGRVVLPAGTPPDEQVWVIARGGTFPRSRGCRTHEVALTPDGTFRVAFAPGTRRGSVELGARYLYLGRSVSVDVDGLPDEVLLEPLLGARGLLTVRPPAGADSGELGEVVVRWAAENPGRPQDFAMRVATDHENGVFEFTSLPVGGSLYAAIASRSWCDHTELIRDLRSGEIREVACELTRGGRLTGRVYDGDGAPLAGVQLEATSTSSPAEGVSRIIAVEAQSSEGGGFDLRGIAPGVVIVEAAHTEHLGHRKPLGRVMDGDLREGFELRLERGCHLAGRVLWPDGRPVSRAKVEVSQEGLDPDLFPGLRSAVRADEDGRFRVTRLGEEPCTVRAWARPSREQAEWQGLLERRRAGLSARRPNWRALAQEVRPSRTDLVLVLNAGGTIAGRVVDSWGVAVPRFKVIARAADRGLPTQCNTFQVKDGRFKFDGVQPGKWIVTASAGGYVSSSATPVRVPESGELALVMVRKASVTGVVLDPEGRPVPGALVEAQPTPDDPGSYPRRTDGTTGRDGEFELALAPGEYEIHATPGMYGRSEFAASVPVSLSFTPAETRAGLQLTLRPGATISGALDPSVGDLVGRSVSLRQVDGRRSEWTESDALGQFSFQGLPPGEFRIDLYPVSEREEVRGGDTFRNIFDCDVFSTCELREGEERHVVLGAPQ